jgi:hypothetical protein
VIRVYHLVLEHKIRAGWSECVKALGPESLLVCKLYVSRTCVVEHSVTCNMVECF